MATRAVFIDKDGTLVENVPYNVDPRQVRLMPGAAEAMRALHTEGFALIVISNQAGVALGHFAEPALAGVKDALDELAGDMQVPLAGFYYCPHHPAGKIARYARNCDCRKPQPGLIRRAALKHGIDLTRSWLIGDILDDIEAGQRAGCRTVLVNNGNETEWQWSPRRRPDYVVLDLVQAARVIVAGATAEDRLQAAARAMRARARSSHGS
jgi:D-glycero-D-manno-heptose 1,7-bisphosphate phosphatase